VLPRPLGRVASNLGLGIGATVAGFIISSAQHLRSFQTLYVPDAITYAAFALVVLAVVPNRRAATAHASATGGGFRAVARDRRFLIVIAVNIVLIIVGYALYSSILPPFAIAHTRVGPAGIGIIKLANALLAGVATVFAIGECVHGVVLGPLVADLAPTHLLGRYMSMYALMATGGLALGPAIGGVVLATSPDAVWWGGALVAAVIGAGFLRSGDRIPEPPAVEAGGPDVRERPRAATQATN
jgi:MFS family permease